MICHPSLPFDLASNRIAIGRLTFIMQPASVPCLDKTHAPSLPVADEPAVRAPKTALRR